MSSRLATTIDMLSYENVCRIRNFKLVTKIALIEEWCCLKCVLLSECSIRRRISIGGLGDHGNMMFVVTKTTNEYNRMTSLTCPAKLYVPEAIKVLRCVAIGHVRVRNRYCYFQLTRLEIEAKIIKLANGKLYYQIIMTIVINVEFRIKRSDVRL